MKLKHFRGLFQKDNLTVLEVNNPYDNYYTIKLDSNELNWNAGEHAIFTIPNKKIEGKKWRAFSIASSPKEGYMLLGTRTGKTPSSFKQQLISLKPGDTMSLRGPFGWFLVEHNKPVVLFAQGIGITPIRAILNDLKDNRDITVVYSSKHYLFKEEFDQMGENVMFAYTSSKEETEDILNRLTDEYGNNAVYYISGSPNVIKSTTNLLKQKSIKKKHIINDPFLGY